MLSLYIYPGDRIARKVFLAEPISHMKISPNIRSGGARSQDISRCAVIPEKELSISKYLIIDRSDIDFCGDIPIAICQVLDYQLIIDYQ